MNLDLYLYFPKGSRVVPILSNLFLSIVPMLMFNNYSYGNVRSSSICSSDGMSSKVGVGISSYSRGYTYNTS